MLPALLHGQSGEQAFLPFPPDQHHQRPDADAGQEFPPAVAVLLLVELCSGVKLWYFIFAPNDSAGERQLFEHQSGDLDVGQTEG